MSKTTNKTSSDYLENLECWQQAKRLAVDMYHMSTNGNLNQDDILGDQLRKSAISIASHIACGREQSSASGFIQFLGAAKGSAAELRTQLAISREVGYLSEGDFLEFEDKINRICAMIGGLIRAIKRRLQNKTESSSEARQEQASP